MSVSQQGYPPAVSEPSSRFYSRTTDAGGYRHDYRNQSTTSQSEQLDNRYDPSSVSCYPTAHRPMGQYSPPANPYQHYSNHNPGGYPPMAFGSDNRLSYPASYQGPPAMTSDTVPGEDYRNQTQIAMINHAGLNYGHQLPWYGGPPRAYPIPPGHMYNMYHFNRYEYDDSKAACKILNGREARNRAEKNRRDKLNGSIQELSGMVPHVAESPRRVDKTAVLRFSAHALRVDYVFGKATPEPSKVVKPDVQDSLFRMLNGFLLTVTCRGQIVLVSASVEQFLGHCQTDLYGQNLFNLVHPDDQSLLKQQLVPSNLVGLFDPPATSAPSTSSVTQLSTLSSPPPTAAGSHTTTEGDASEEQQRRNQQDEAEIDRKLRQDRRKFSIRIARAGPRSEPTAYELVTIDGCFRRADAAPRGAKPSGPSGMQLLRRGRGRDDGISLHSINGNDIVLVAMARVMKVPTICDRLIEACKYEYKTRHLIDGRIVQCDHRISVVAGYMTNEVSGLSPFTFMHKDDVRWVIVALRQMYDFNQKDGESCYRLMTRTGDFIYLKTRGILEVDSTTKKVQSFVCINTLVSDEEGRRLVREMKHKFSVIVDQEELAEDADEEPAVENAQQIERAVLNLITNLHPDEDEEQQRSTVVNASPSPAVSDGLAIIAPKASAVKSAIVKSMSVIAVASKKMSVENGNSSPLRDSSSKSNQRAGADVTQRPSVLQKTHNQSSNSHQQQQQETRVPPLPTSEHYFMQPFSPANSTSSNSSGSNHSVLSAASQQQFQRNSRSPFGGNVPPASPPTLAGASASYSRVTHYDNTASGHTRTTSVLKRTYSNSSIGSSSSTEYSATAGTGGDFQELKRPKASSSDFNACLSELVNPSSDLTTMLPNAFDAVDQSLLTIESTTAIMREQVGSYEDLQHSQHRIDRIVEEQQEQREILQSIQQEFTFQIQSNGGDAADARLADEVRVHPPSPLIHLGDNLGGPEGSVVVVNELRRSREDRSYDENCAPTTTATSVITAFRRTDLSPS